MGYILVILLDKWSNQQDEWHTHIYTTSAASLLP
jgi:hypothetical protein